MSAFEKLHAAEILMAVVLGTKHPRYCALAPTAQLNGGGRHASPSPEVRRNKICRLQGADTPLVHKQATANAGHGAFGYRATLTNYPAFKLQASGMGTAARFLYKPSCPEKDSSLERIVFTQPTIKLSRSGFNTFPAPGEDAYVSLSTRILSHRLRRIIFFPASSKFWLTLLEWEALRGLLSKLRMTQTVVLGTNQYKSWRLECS